MAKQKKSKEKSQKKTRSVKMQNLTQTQLRNRWIMASIGLILLLIIIFVLVVLVFTNKVQIPGIPQFASGKIKSDPETGSSELQDYMSDYARKYDNYNYEEFYNNQMSKPAIGEEIVEIHFAGEKKPVKAKLFPEEAPEIVKQFKELVKSGYYNGLDFGPHTGHVLLSVSTDLSKSWDTMEVKSNKVLPYNGALCADAFQKAKLETVNFFFMSMDSKNATSLNTLNLPEKLKALFRKHGGDVAYIADLRYNPDDSSPNPHANLLDYMKHPTFGQVFEGMETIEKLTKTYKSYKISKIEITTYNE